MSRRLVLLIVLLAAGLGVLAQPAPTEWGRGFEGQRKADLGNGQFLNPILAGDHPDPSILKDGDDYYMTFSSFDAYPGLVIWHSRDLVNWDFVAYASDRLDFGPEYRLEDGKSIYGQGIWAPSFRYHDGTFYIFSNVNNLGLQVVFPQNNNGVFVDSHDRQSIVFVRQP